MVGRLEFVSQPPEFRFLTIDGDGVELGDGWIMSPAEIERIRALAGRKVIAASSRWSNDDSRFGITTTSKLACIGAAEDAQWSHLASACQALQRDEGWRSNARSLERGEWRREVVSRWRHGSENELLAELRRIVRDTDPVELAKDVTGWFADTLGADLQALELRAVATDYGEPYAWSIVRHCLRMPQVKPDRVLESPEAWARRMWISVRMQELSAPAVR